MFDKIKLDGYKIPYVNYDFRLIPLKEILKFLTHKSRVTVKEREYINVLYLENELNILSKLKKKFQIDLSFSLKEFLGQMEEHSLLPFTSMANEIFYYPRTEELVIEYASGKSYTYYNVDVEVWLNLLITDEQDSISKYIRENIRGNKAYFEKRKAIA